MMLEEPDRMKAAVEAFFVDSEAAAIAAVSEVLVAEMSPEAAVAVWRDLGEPEGISVSDAVLVHAIKRGKAWLLFNPTGPRVSRDPPTLAPQESSSMKNRDAFESLGQHVRGGPLPPPFGEPATARDVALAIRAALVEVGLSANAIRKIGCVLISISRHSDRRSDASPIHAKSEERSDYE